MLSKTSSAPDTKMYLWRK